MNRIMNLRNVDLNNNLRGRSKLKNLRLGQKLVYGPHFLFWTYNMTFRVKNNAQLLKSI